jgi:hypothetical protein
MDLSKYFKSSANTTSKESKVTSFMYEIFFAESSYPTHLRNGIIADIVCEKLPGSKTTSKSVASIRSKQSGRIAHYIALRKEGTAHSEAFEAARAAAASK